MNEIPANRAMLWLLRVLIIAGVGLVGLAIWAQPRVADDWYLAWHLVDSGSFWNFEVEMYQGWGGRVLPFMMAGLVLSSETATFAFKLLTVPCFFLLSACAYYLATGVALRFGRGEWGNFLLMTAVLWLGVPVASDTIIQTTGACAYLWPAAAGFVLLCLFRKARDRAHLGQVESGGWHIRIGWLVAGIVVGTGNEQLFAGMAVVLVGWGWMLWQNGRLRYLPREAWWGLAGLIVGTLIMIAAPGNYIRLGAAENGGGGLFSMLVRFAMYLGGAYFGLGTGDVGRTLWMGIAVIALSGTLTLAEGRSREAGIWMAGSLATLAPMFPLVNFASPRTTFLAVIFLVIAAMIVFPRKTGTDTPTPAVSWLVAFIMATLVLFDGFVGWAANRSLSVEMAARKNIIQAAAADGRKEVVLPYLATIPSRLTFMVPPQYDAKFITVLASRNGLANARYDESVSAPKPQTLNSLKSLKNSF